MEDEDEDAASGEGTMVADGEAPADGEELADDNDEAASGSSSAWASEAVDVSVRSLARSKHASRRRRTS